MTTMISRDNTEKLKVWALVLMTIDHIGLVFENQLPFEVMMILRILGRLSFPVFAYCISVSAVHTRSKKNYLIRLGVAAVISQPFFMLLTGGLNILFTFLIAVMAIWLYVLAEKKIGFLALSIPVGLGALGELVHVDYGIYGILMVFLFYIFRDRFSTMALSLLALNLLVISVPQLDVGSTQLFTMFALIIIWFYMHRTDRPARIHLPRQLFYIYYPIHIGALWLLRYALFFWGK